MTGRPGDVFFAWGKLAAEEKKRGWGFQSVFCLLFSLFFFQGWGGCRTDESAGINSCMSGAGPG